MIGDKRQDYLETISEDKKIIIRKIKENGHPVITHKMFKKVALSRIAAAKAIIQENKPKDEASKLKELNILEGNLHLFFSKTKEEAEFEKAKNRHYEVTQKLTTSQAKAGRVLFDVQQEYQRAFDKVYEQNITKLKEVSVLIAHHVAPHQSANKVLKQINDKDNLLRTKQERPIQNNYYEVPASEGAEKLTIQSTHIPEGELIDSQKELYQEVFNLSTV